MKLSYRYRRAKQIEKFLCNEDILMALRNAYYVKNVSVVPDVLYDKWEKRELRHASPASPLHKPGSDHNDDYSPRIRALAMYFCFLVNGDRTR